MQGPRPRVVAAVGFVAWAAAWAIEGWALADALLLLGPLVVVPLGLGLAAGSTSAPLRGRWAWVGWLQPVAALLLVVAFAQPAGPEAGPWTLPWLMVATLVALLGLLRLVEHGARPAGELAIGFGMLYLAVGAFWLTVSRAAWTVGGFGDPIAFLTAAHFHFAGFALPILAGVACRRLPGWHSRLACYGVVAGMPLVATGIVLAARGTPGFEPYAVVFFAAAALLVAALHLRLALAPGPLAPRVLWGASGVGLSAGLGLAVAWATGRALGTPWITLEGMVRTHAVLNALGFTLCGMAAWALARVPAPAPAFQLLLPAFGDEPDRAAWAQRPVDGRVLAGPPPRALRDRHQATVGTEPPGPPVADGAFRHAVDAVMRYRVFPDAMLRPADDYGPVQAGDTLVGSHVIVGGLEIAFGSRVARVFEGVDGHLWRTGFAYQTLEGHPECGQESFTVEKDMESGDVRVVLEAWSMPGHPVTRLLRGMARRRQLAAGSAAPQHVAAALRARDPTGGNGPGLLPA